MFESLDDRIKQDEQGSTSAKERVVRYLAVAVLSVLVFAGLYFSVQLLEG